MKFERWTSMRCGQNLSWRSESIFTMKDINDNPSFENEDQEREFWSEHDSTEFIDLSQAETAVFPRLKPTTTC